MATVRDMRERAGIQAVELAQEAKVSIQTLWRLETGTSVTRITAYKVVNALNRLLGTQYDLKDIDGISLK